MQNFATRCLWGYNDERPSMSIGAITPKQAIPHLYIRKQIENGRTTMIKLETLINKEQFLARKKAAWEANTGYWLASSLRHVEDIGDFIVSRVEIALQESNEKRPLVVDMGFGNAWLLDKLLSRKLEFSYLGLDNHEGFLSYARDKYQSMQHARFEYADFEKPLPDELYGNASILVNAFNFFELTDLTVPMRNAAKVIKDDGKLLVATIDKTFLMMAGCKTWQEWIEVLKEYQNLQGPKYFFQAIDLGDKESIELVYPSVLWSLNDYLDEARASDINMTFYKEFEFTAKPIPKIYQYMEFEPVGWGEQSEAHQ